MEKAILAVKILLLITWSLLFLCRLVRAHRYYLLSTAVHFDIVSGEAQRAR